MTKRTNYASRNEDIKEAMIDSFHKLASMGGKHSDPGHLTSCAANDAYELTSKQWNAKMGADAFASTLATLVMNGDIKLSFSEEMKEQYGLVN